MYVWYLASLVGRYFGMNGVQLDKYGANLASACLPGAGFRRIHNKQQDLVRSMMKLAGIHSEKEAINFLQGKVGDPYMQNYADHQTSQDGGRNAPHSIIPDIHALNFPAGTQTVNHSGATHCGEAIFEIKGMQPNNTRYGHNNSKINPADRRARDVVNESGEDGICPSPLYAI